MKNFRLDLKARILIITSLTAFLTAMAIFFLTKELFEKFIYQRFQEKLSFLAKHTASSSSLGLLLRDQHLLTNIAKSLLKERAIVAVEIKDSRKETIIELGKKEKADGKIVKKVEIESKDPLQKPQYLGEIQIYYTTKHLKSVLEKMMWQIFLVSLIMATIMGIAGYIIITRAFIKPFNELLAAVKEVEKGKLDIEISGKGLPETEILARAFSDMLLSLKKSNEELKRTYEEIARNKAMAEIGKFSLIIAHEIKNPLGIMKGSIDILKKEEVDPTIKKEMIKYIDEEIKRVDLLIQNFLSFAKPQKIHRQKIKIKEFLENIQKRAQIEFGPKVNLKLIINENKEINIDPEKMERVIMNILKNAQEAGAKNIIIKQIIKQENLIIEIIDDGKGIDIEEKEKIFEPFFTTKSKGTGLGLAIVKQIIEAHNGKISAESNNGCKFKIVIPIN